MLIDILQLSINYLPYTKIIKENPDLICKQTTTKCKIKKHLNHKNKIINLKNNDINGIKRRIEFALPKNVIWFNNSYNIGTSIKITAGELSLLITNGESDDCVFVSLTGESFLVNIYYLVRRPSNSIWVNNLKTIYFKELERAPDISKELAAQIFVMRKFNKTIFHKKIKMDFVYLYNINVNVSRYTLIEYLEDIIKYIHNQIYPLKIRFTVKNYIISNWKVVLDSDIYDSIYC